MFGFENGEKDVAEKSALLGSQAQGPRRAQRVRQYRANNAAVDKQTVDNLGRKRIKKGYVVEADRSTDPSDRGYGSFGSNLDAGKHTSVDDSV